MKFLFPVPRYSVMTQGFDGHVQRARQNGWCPAPAPGCKTYYYGGIDWAIPAGTPIKAAASGVVSIARKDTTGYGVHVRIKHDEGWETVYGHLQEYVVKAGDRVKAGDVIGYGDNTGFSSGPHLHFEARKNGVPKDPAPMLVDAIEPEPEPEPIPVEGLPVFPVLPRAVVTAEMLNVRGGPSVGDKPVGSLQEGKEIEVIRAIKSGGDVWLQIGDKQFVAMLFGGEQYIKFDKGS